MDYQQFYWFVTGYCNSAPDTDWSQTIKAVADTVTEIKEVQDPVSPIVIPDIPNDDIAGFLDMLDELPIEDLSVFGDKPINTEKQEWEVDDGKTKEVKSDK